MNRRHLFKLIGGALCAAAIEITGIAPQVVRKVKYVVNPAYYVAEYEDIVAFGESASYTLRSKRCPSGDGDTSHEITLPPGLNSIVVSREAYYKMMKAGMDLSKVTIDNSASRYDFTDGEWVRVPMLVEEGSI